MSAVKGVNATKASTGFIGSDILDPGQSQGIVKCIRDEYEASSLANASTITLGSLIPTGAVVLDILFQWDDMGSTVTFKAGDATDDDRYVVASTSVTTANASVRITNIAGNGYQVTGTADNQIIVTTAGIWTGTFKMTLYYTMA